MSTSTIALKVAQKLRKLRIKHGLTQEQIAERADLPIRYYQKLESKSPYAVRITTLEKLAKGLKIPVWKLLQFKD